MSLAVGSALMIAIVAVRYVVVSGFFAWLTARTGRDPHTDRTRRAAQVRREIGWSLLSAAIYGLPAGVVGVLWQTRGWTAIYDGTPAGAGWLWLPASVLIYLAVHDTWFYWSHRWMHRPAVFRRVHAVHHDSRPPTAWAAMSFAPSEAASGAWLIPALAFVVPIHAGALMLVLAIMTFNGVTNHMGWELYPRSWLDGWWGRTMITASHHHLHHRHYRCNYGLYFRFWDRACGTDRGWARELGHDDVAVPKVGAEPRRVAA
ncbi:MAG: sterol desaturase family protein [Janthinobacterium lividum]